MQYAKKPIMIEAFHYGVDMFYPGWLVKAQADGIFYFVDDKEKHTHKAFIKTLEGNMEVSMGDYIIQGIKGELYPCKEDIFKETYKECYNGERMNKDQKDVVIWTVIGLIKDMITTYKWKDYHDYYPILQLLIFNLNENDKTYIRNKIEEMNDINYNKVSAMNTLKRDNII